MSGLARPGRTIQLFLVDGRPSGLRKATLHGWTGIIFVAGDAAFAQMMAREEADRTGVYFLSGPDPEGDGRMRVYIGCGNSVAERIRQSALKRDFWETAVSITTSDDDLSKGHAEYLEARLIEIAASAGRVVLDNGTQPETSRRRLPEADRANMEQFLENIRIVLPVVGLDLLKPQPRAVEKATLPLPERIEDETRFEIRHKSGVSALAVEEDGEFVVLEGSEALIDTGNRGRAYSTLRDRLRADGVLQPKSDGLVAFTAPYSFASPSAAAAIVLDRNANGRTEWKVEGSTETYHEWKVRHAAGEEAE